MPSTADAAPSPSCMDGGGAAPGTTTSDAPAPRGAAGAGPAGRDPAAPNPGGRNPAGRNPAGRNPVGPDPAGSDPAGRSEPAAGPAGSGPAGGGVVRGVAPRARGNRWLVTAGVALLLAAAAVAAGMAWTRGTADRPAATPVVATAPVPVRTTPPSRSARQAAPARPLTVRIPAIGISSTLVPLRLNPAGALQPPDDFVHAGWYVGGPTPGELGPAVIAGHVDSRKGPAIFFRLRELKPGDQVLVTRSDHRTVR
ncbi:MAG: hypothetical protein V7637_3601, partial [Mycobacteriales bacterium]